MKIFVTLMLLIVMFSSCQKAPEVASKSIWKPYSKQALEDSIARKIPVVIDFFAEWCPNCHELDRTVFSLPDIQSKLSQVTALRMDVTDQDNPEVQKIATEYSIDGVPTVIFINSHGQEIDNSRVIGYVTPKEFSQSLALFKIFK